MNVLIANTLYYPEVVGGAEMSTQILAEGLARAGINVSVVCATGSGDDRMRRVNGVNVHYLRLSNLYWPYSMKQRSPLMKAIWHAFDTQNILMARRFRQIVEAEKPDIINTSNLSCLSLGLWRIANERGVPIVHTVRDYYLMCPAAEMFSNNKACARQCRSCAMYAAPKRRKSARVEAVIGVSDYILRKHLERGFFPRASIACVINDCYLPLDNGSAPGTVSPAGAREAGVVRLGVLGRISPEKGIELVLEQCMRLTGRRWRLLIGGTGHPAYVDGLRRQYGDERIVFLGHVKPQAFFAGIDILVVPSKWNEPFGRVTAEAYSHGVPVVGANTGGIPEVIEPCSALLFDVNEPDTLLEKIHAAIAMLDDPGLRGRLLKHAESFGPTRMINAYIHLYQRLSNRLPETLPSAEASSA